MLSPLKLFALKLALFSLVLGYIAADFFLFQGPLWHAIHDEKHPEGELNRPLAMVFGQAIDERRLNDSLQELAYLSGEDSDDSRLRISRLLELIRAEMLRMRTLYNDSNLPDCQEEAEAELRQLQTHPQYRELLQQAALNESEILAFLRERFREQALILRSLLKYSAVSEEEIVAEYESLNEELYLPDSRHVEHLFLSFQDKDELAVKQLAEALLQRVAVGESLESIAAEYHDAPFDLGVIADDARRALPELPLFGENAIPAGQVCLARSAWGYHLLLAQPLVAAHSPSLDECRESIRTALISAKRELALEAYLDESIKELFRTKQLKIYER